MDDMDGQTLRERLSRQDRGLRCAVWMRASKGLLTYWWDD